MLTADSPNFPVNDAAAELDCIVHFWCVTNGFENESKTKQETIHKTGGQTSGKLPSNPNGIYDNEMKEVKGRYDRCIRNVFGLEKKMEAKSGHTGRVTCGWPKVAQEWVGSINGLHLTLFTRWSKRGST